MTSPCIVLVLFSSKIATSHGDHTIKVFEVKTGKRLASLVGHSRTAWTLCYHPYHNNIIASGSLDGEIKVWDLLVSYIKWSTYIGWVKKGWNKFHIWLWSMIYLPVTYESNEMVVMETSFPGLKDEWFYQIDFISKWAFDWLFNTLFLNIVHILFIPHAMKHCNSFSFTHLMKYIVFYFCFPSMVKV